MLRRELLLGSGLLMAIPEAFAINPTNTNIVVFWDSVATTRIKFNPQLGPIGDALMGAGLHNCIYNAWATYSNTSVNSFHTTNRRPESERTDENKAKAISFAAYRFLCDRFPDNDSKVIFNNAMQSMGYNVADESFDESTPAGIGNKAANDVIEERSKDGSNYNGKLNGKGAYSDHTGYVPVNAPLEFCNPSNSESNAKFVLPKDIFAWSPLKNPAGVIQKFAGSQMGMVTPFAISKSEISMFEKLLQKPDYLKDLTAYKKEVDKSIWYSAHLTPMQKLSVEFWADGPGSTYFPTAHWRYFTKTVVESHKYNIDDTVKIYYAVAIAAADAGIMTWLEKRNVNGSRPITGIRTIYNNSKIVAWGGPGHPTESIYGNTWSPFNPSDPNMVVAHQSPGFPGWPSGHTMFSSSCSRVLQQYTNSDTFNFSVTIPENFGIVEQGNPLKPTQIQFKTFTDAAKSATASRIWSGIHYTPDCNEYVMDVGRKVGDISWNKAKLLFAGG